MNGVKEIQGEAFQREVLDADVPVVVDFFATWCAPCRMLAPVLESLAGLYGDKLRFVKVNVEDATDLAIQYGIRGVPTVMVFRGGEAVDSIVGLLPPNALKQKLDAVAAVAPART